MVQEGQISESDANAFTSFVNLKNMPSMNIYILGRLGKLQHLEDDAGYNATVKVLESMGLGAVQFDRKTAMPFEEQFWKQYDAVFELNEDEMMEELPLFTADPTDKAKLESLIDNRTKSLE